MQECKHWKIQKISELLIGGFYILKNKRVRQKKRLYHLQYEQPLFYAQLSFYIRPIVFKIKCMGFSIVLFDPFSWTLRVISFMLRGEVFGKAKLVDHLIDNLSVF